MKINVINNNKITALSALKRRNSAPQLVVVAPSGTGKSTLVYLLLSHRLIPYMKIGIGDKSQTTIIPCEFCFDERIANEETFAIQIIKKDYAYKDIHIAILTLLMELFGKNDCDAEDTLDAFDEEVFEQVIEPVEAMYHLGSIRKQLSLEELKETLAPILDFMIVNGFREKVKQRRDELKSKKVKLSEVRELIFEEMFEEMEENIKADYVAWLNNIGAIVSEMLLNAIGAILFSHEMVEYSLAGNAENNGTEILTALFDPQTPYNLIIDHILIASRPRKELIDIAKSKSPDMPFRFCIRDTMGLTQKGIDAASTKDALEVALNCKADTILFLMSLEDRDDALTECCKALVEKKDELKKKSHLETSVYVLFTKADRIIENLINKRNAGGLYIDEDTYAQNIQDVLTNIEGMVSTYANMIPQEEVGWLSMRYVKDSYILKSLKDDFRKRNFEPEGLFDKIVDYSMKTLQSTLPVGVNDPLFVTAIKPDEPVIKVSVKPDMIKDNIVEMQQALTEDVDIVNGYTISDKTPRLHGKSVHVYWHNLPLGVGHTTKASVYGNFSINMKGLLKRMIKNAFPSFEEFDKHCAVTFTADNLTDEVFQDVMKILFCGEDIKVGMNPALGNRNIYLQRLYEFYKVYFMEESRYASLVERVSYDMSYGNDEIKKHLTAIYNNTPGYDSAMRKLQISFKELFGSEDFSRILIVELNSVMTDMVNKMFVAI